MPCDSTVVSCDLPFHTTHGGLQLCACHVQSTGGWQSSLLGGGPPREKEEGEEEKEGGGGGRG